MKNLFGLNNEEDNYKYKGWLNSDFLLKRVLAFFGYSVLSTLLVWVVILLFLIFLAALTFLINLVF